MQDPMRAAADTFAALVILKCAGGASDESPAAGARGNCHKRAESWRDGIGSHSMGTMRIPICEEPWEDIRIATY